jgi:tetratricopeptide (TPR) repeat protein
MSVDTENIPSTNAALALKAILGSVPASRSKAASAIEKYIGLTKEGKQWKFELTEAGEAIDSRYRQTFQLAEEKGPRDRDVVSQMTELASEWSSYPGVVENTANDHLEAEKPELAVDVVATAMKEWASLVKKAGVKLPEQLIGGTPGNVLFVQLLANYEFTLERAGDLEKALGVAKLARALEPSDPENILSSIVSLSIRVGEWEEALNELDRIPESVAPFALYGRALAFFKGGQLENASSAIQNALRYWPSVAEGISREWKTGTPMPKPGEAVSELQVLYGYFEVFGPAWAAVEGALEWLRGEEKKFKVSGGKPAQHVGLTRSGLKTDGHGNILPPTSEQEDMIANAKVIGSDEFVRFLEVQRNSYVYDLTERGKALEDELLGLFRKDMKFHDRLDAIKGLLEQWPGHTSAAVSLARFYVSEKKLDQAVDTLEKSIFALQTFWPDDLIETGKLEIEWAGNKPMLTAYAHMVLDCAEAGELQAGRDFATDYLTINPKDNLGVRQKAIELAIRTGDIDGALTLIDNAFDPQSAHNIFGRALAYFIQGKRDEANVALTLAVQNRPKIYRELTADKHRMPHNYNPGFVLYFSAEEAYNYNVLWSTLWRNTLGALAWLRKDGRKALLEAPKE